MVRDKAARDRFRATKMSLKAADAVFSRQDTSSKDEFDGLYSKHRLLVPPYDFTSLYRIYDESDILQECIEAMVQNIDGFGYEMLFLGDDLNERDGPMAQAQLTRCKSFFDYANDKESMRSVRKKVRRDMEVIGNGGVEIIRNRIGKIQLMYHISFQQVRISALQGRAVEVTVMLKRDGKLIPIKIKKYFRKFCMVHATTRKRVRWFKEMGDPRIMDATTGDYMKKGQKPKMIASELIHFSLPGSGSAYGLPRWIGVVLDILGRRSAQYVNWDLFESQGIPPMAITVSNGVLTDESYEELETLIRGMRGVEKWNKILILESNVDSVGLEEKGTAKIELKNLSEYRKEDQMFSNYLSSIEETVRQRYRLPPLYVGSASSFTHSTAKAAQTVAEEQVFIPEREEFDEEVNRIIVLPELGVDLWAYKSKGPRAVGTDEITKGVASFLNAGALTVNHSIDLANRAFGLEMSKYKYKWADYPLNIILEVMKRGGSVDGLEEVATLPVADKPIPASGAKPKQISATPQKILKSDLFNDAEKTVYKKLLFLQDAIDKGLEEGLITEEDWGSEDVPELPAE